MVEKADNVWADGPAGSPFQPEKSSIRKWGSWVESIIAAFITDGRILHVTRADLYSNLAPGNASSAWVVGDPNVAYNGVYVKTGASGTGFWTRAADLPYSFIIASDAGAGTPNAIQATTSIPVSASALIWVNVYESNTSSPVTISFNGGSPLTIKTNSGHDISMAGGLTAGMIMLGIVSGSTFRLVSDQASAALLSQVEAVVDGIDVDAFLKSDEIVPEANLRDTLRGFNQITDANSMTSSGWSLGQNALNAPTNTGVNDWYVYTFDGSSSGPTGKQTAIAFFTTNEYVRYVLNGVWGSWQRSYSGDQLDARFVRFWPDTSRSPFGTQRVRVGINNGIIEDVIPGSENNGWLNSISPIGRAGAVFGSRSSDNPTVGDSGTYASGHFVIHNSDKEAWVQYSEGRVEAGAGGICGHEINVISKKTLISNDPYNIYAPHSVTDQILSSGRPDVPGSLPLSSYLNIQHNGADADKGINIGYNAVTVKSGQADAINLAKNHAIQQWSASGFRGAGIRFDVVDSTQSLLQIFGDSFVKWRLRDAGLDALLLTTTLLTSYVPVKFPSFTKAAKPSASALGAGVTIDITNDTSNRRLATSDGTNWRFQDGTVVPAS